MSDNKGYYWMKLNTKFFQSKDMTVVRDMEDGWKLIGLWLQMILLSIENRDTPGLLIYHKNLPYNEDLLSRVTGLSEEIIKRGLKLFTELGMIEMTKDGGIWIDCANEVIGKSSTEGDRKRVYRAKLKEAGQKRDNVPCVPDKQPPELEIDTDREKEKEAQAKARAILSSAKEVIKYLNEKVGKHYQVTANSPGIEFARSRLIEGYTVDQLKFVVDVKTAEWKDNEKMRPYLRPSTLFQKTKCADYVQQKLSKQQAKNLMVECPVCTYPAALSGMCPQCKFEMRFINDEPRVGDHKRWWSDKQTGALPKVEIPKRLRR